MESKRLIICFLLLLIAQEGSATYRIYVKIGNRKTSLDVEMSDMLYNVKIFLEDKKGIPASKQRLFLGGRELQDNRTLADYNIRRNATLRLLIRN